MSFLTGLNVLIIRPQQQARKFQKLIEALGAKAILFPVLEIQFLLDAQQWLSTINIMKKNDVAIFTSANAVPPLPGNLLTENIAIGSGTAEAMAQQGWVTHFLPEKFTSEGILELPILQGIQNRRVFIFCGENPRALLRESLKQRRAEVIEIRVYRRHKPSLERMEKEWRELSRSSINIIVANSEESLSNLYDFVAPRALKWLQSIPLLVISDQMLACAHQLNLQQSIIVAENASDRAVIKALQSWNESHKHEQHIN